MERITVMNENHLAVATCGNTERFVGIGELGRVIEMREASAVVLWRRGGSGEYSLDDLFIREVIKIEVPDIPAGDQWGRDSYGGWYERGE